MAPKENLRDFLHMIICIEIIRYITLLFVWFFKIKPFFIVWRFSLKFSIVISGHVLRKMKILQSFGFIAVIYLLIN